MANDGSRRAQMILDAKYWQQGGVTRSLGFKNCYRRMLLLLLVISTVSCLLHSCHAQVPAPGTTPPASSGKSVSAKIIIAVVNFAGILLVGLGVLSYLRDRHTTFKLAKLAAGDADPGKLVPEQPVAPEADVESRAGGGVGRRGPVAEAADQSELLFVDDAYEKFDLEDLLRASAEILGKGIVGTTYRARLGAGKVVAVKRLKDVKDMGKREFEKHMAILGQMIHPNLLPLRAYYYAREEKLLVYDYMYCGSLASILHGSKDKESGQLPLDWHCRLNVAYEVALGLSFLHGKCPSHLFPHQNLKSSNILLGNDYEAYLADYCLVPLMPPKITTRGMTGYAAPEYNRSRRRTTKADVYSFGVLLLELLTGRQPEHSSDEGEGIDLAKYVKDVAKEGWTEEVLDADLKSAGYGDTEMVTVLQLAVGCVHDNPDQRPPLSEVLKVLEGLSKSNDDFPAADTQSREIPESKEIDGSYNYDSREYDSIDFGGSEYDFCKDNNVHRV